LQIGTGQKKEGPQSQHGKEGKSPSFAELVSMVSFPEDIRRKRRESTKNLTAGGGRKG